ncbi:hypothetical protein GCM10029964_100830 [Kibdelosporangium lantanae]
MRKSIAAIAAALALAGCSSAGNSGQAGGDQKTAATDACGLLTDEQINQAAQLGPRAHAPIPDNPLRTCKWDLNGENNFVKIYSGDAKMFDGGKGDTLAGLGDKAVWDGGARKVQAVRGDTGFELWIQLFNQQDHEQAAAITLANDVAAKLGWSGAAKVPAGGSASKTTSAPTTSTKETTTATTKATTEDETSTEKTTGSPDSDDTTTSTSTEDN